MFNWCGRMGRRHRLDIFADILRLAKNGTKVTRLVYQANLNFTIIKKYLQKLTEKGFVESFDGHICTTEKGSEFLKKYEELMVLFNSFDNGEPKAKPVDPQDLIVEENLRKE